MHAPIGFWQATWDSLLAVGKEAAPLFVIGVLGYGALRWHERKEA